METLAISRKDADITLTDLQRQVSRLYAELIVSEDGSYYLTDVQRTDEIRFGGHDQTTVRELVRQSEPGLTMM